jgi:hypothetical protein
MALQATSVAWKSWEYCMMVSMIIERACLAGDVRPGKVMPDPNLIHALRPVRAAASGRQGTSLSFRVINQIEMSKQPGDQWPLCGQNLQLKKVVRRGNDDNV